MRLSKVDDAKLFNKNGQHIGTWTLIRQSEKDTPGYALHAGKTRLEGTTFFAPNAWPNMHDFASNKEVYEGVHGARNYEVQ